MKFEYFIAKRYLRSKRRTKFISLITYISIIGIVIGVAALIIVLSVMNGFEDQVRSRFLGADAHVKVLAFHDNGIKHYGHIINEIKSTPYLKTMSPFISEKGLIKSKRTQAGMVVRGIDPASAKEVIDLSKNVIFGSLDFEQSAETTGDSLPGIVLGFQLAQRLQVILGDEVAVFSLAGVRHFRDVPTVKKFRVSGYFETGLYEFDDRIAYISIKSAQQLYQMESKVSGIWIKLNHYSKAETVAEKIEKKIGYPYQVMTWKDMNPNLFAWMKIEKWAAFIILSLIITVAAFNIVSTLIMVTLEKTREIGILKSMGATSVTIRRIFTCHGLIVGIVGTVVGSFAGFVFCFLQQRFRLFSLPEDIYIISWLPVKMQGTDFLVIGFASILLSFLAAVYPAQKAAKLDPVKSIRYE